jgi:hypothetical protein
MEYMILAVGAANITNALAGLQEQAQQLIDKGATVHGGITIERDGDSICAVQVLTMEQPRIVTTGH